MRANTHPRLCTHTHFPRSRTHAHKSVVLIAFPWQEWFRERASLLRCTYIACLHVSCLWNYTAGRILLIADMEVVCVFSKYVFWSKLWYGLKTLYEAFVWAFVKGLSKRVTSWVVSQILCSRRDTYFILIPKLFVILQSKGVTVDKLNRRVLLVDCGKEMPLSICVSFLIWNEAYTGVVFNPIHFWRHDTRVWDARTSVWQTKKKNETLSTGYIASRETWHFYYWN
jgi:hypothetical protein